MRPCYIGFVIDNLLPEFSSFLKSPSVLLRGWPSTTSIGTMRFGWIAAQVKSENRGVVYELYRPWRRYQAVIFLKSMNVTCRRLVQNLKRYGVKTLFDLNVDYLTPAHGEFFYDTMAPRPEQCEAARKMAVCCDGVIGDSSHLAQVAGQYNSRVVWIPDNVRDDLIVDHSNWGPEKGERLPLLWSGESIKLFELLKIKEVLLEFRDKVRLKIVTNSLEVLDRVYEPYRSELQNLLEKVPNEILPFHCVESLLDFYSKGGVSISPRFLCNSYNLGHTEWKISLAMARSRITLCSEQQSYVDLAERAQGRGIRICRTTADWRFAFQEILSKDFAWESEQKGAMQVVLDHYATNVVARNHLQFVRELIQQEL